MSATQPGQDFGANDWLVEEMYERYQSDPSSVSAEWIEFFKTYSPTTSASGTSAITATTTAPAAAAPKGGTPPVPKSSQARVSTPVASQPAAPVSAPAQPVAQPIAPVVAAQPVAQAAPVVAAQPVVTPPVAQPAPVVAQPATQQVVTPPVAASTSSPTPAQAVVKPAPVLATPDEATIEPLRGVAGRVVASMEGSLSVPTATSVRAIPAKLMIDNRTVINNHLKRGRGGKVSFTHIIAYAMIKALRQMPEMNTFFTELEGKPAIGRPTHINLGIAIDLAKPDGSR